MCANDTIDEDDEETSNHDEEDESELYSDFEFENGEDETESPESVFSRLHLCAAHVLQLALKDMVKASPSVASEVRRAIPE